LLTASVSEYLTSVAAADDCNLCWLGSGDCNELCCGCYIMFDVCILTGFVIGVFGIIHYLHNLQKSDIIYTAAIGTVQR